MMELVDVSDLKSDVRNGREGSNHSIRKNNLKKNKKKVIIN